MGHFAERSGVHVWSGHLGGVQPQQWADFGCAGPSIGHGRLQLVAGQECRDYFLRWACSVDNRSFFFFLFIRWTDSDFPAPNYCYRCGNQAAIMEIDEHLKYTL